MTVPEKLQTVLENKNFQTLADFLEFVYENIDPNLDQNTNFMFEYDMLSFGSEYNGICSGCMATACIVSAIDWDLEDYCKINDNIQDKYLLDFESCIDAIRVFNIEFACHLISKIPELKHVYREFEKSDLYEFYKNNSGSYPIFIDYMKVLRIYNADDLKQFFAHNDHIRIVEEFRNLNGLAKKLEKHKENFYNVH